MMYNIQNLITRKTKIHKQSALQLKVPHMHCAPLTDNKTLFEAF